MYISHVTIKNYRNLRNVDVDLKRETVVVGENNGGKSNFLRAITLPLISDEIAYTSKNLSWQDINNTAKENYYNFLLENKESIVDKTLEFSAFEESVPSIVVEVTLFPKKAELYDVKDFICNITTDKTEYKIRYEFAPKIDELWDRVQSIMLHNAISESSIKQYQMNLLPTDLYSYTISVPEKNEKIPYDTLRRFKYTSLEAERDNFSLSTDKLGSKSLIHLLQMKLDEDAKLKVEQEYRHFFETIKNVSKMEEIINWQENSEIKRAKDFFDKISVLPNMPSMSSILNSVQLGYDGQSLSTQGLGYRNLLLMLVLINSLTETENLSLDVLTVEEPEAHLCISNIRLMKGFLNAFTEQNNFVQLIYSTHSPELIGKVDFSNVVVLHQGNAFSLSAELKDKSLLNYLSKNPNVDIYNLLFAKKCILVEGLTEELLIKAYLQSKSELNDIEVISFHKGYIDIIDIWLRLNENSTNRLGIVRDYDNQDNAKDKHEKYNNFKNVMVATTTEYTLEPEIVKAGNNLEVLKKKYGSRFGWENMTADKVQIDWRNSKSFIMLDICQDLINGRLSDFVMPPHIQKVLDFMMEEGKS